MRADQALVARGLAGSRTLAVRLIAAGSVRLETGHGARLVLKPSEQIGGDALLRVDTSDPMLRYVSRGGLKLEAALRRLAELDPLACLDWPDAVALDVGLSTGGFADCLLRHGVGQVVGVDVGHGQLHSSLVGRPRLRAFEGVNARFLDAAALGDAALSANTTGGVFLAGGVAARLEPWLREASALARFHARGPRTELLRDVPIRLITSETAPLLGAALLWLDRASRGWI